MVKKIILIVLFLALISGGTVFALDKLSSKQKVDEAISIELEKEEYKSPTTQNKVIEIINPANPNEIKRHWTGKDGLTYKLEALRNEDGTYTGSIRGLNMYDGFIEYNFIFKELSQSGFDNLFDK
ncbi:MAG: hypothetical protein FD141_110 [Fusobacteria bacterium]|nr:MAG: hypothetical protein FD141_110 [Fusobacteriota bacterium]KAF0229226.1 MAG: hypothetical protein FD182_1482 [Fusobacteriota bacterium]